MKAKNVGWFEIPVLDMERATSFYETIFEIKIQAQQFGETKMGWFPYDHENPQEGASGSLIMNPGHYKPSSNGVLIYFSSVEINDELSRVEGAGGVILQKKTQISPEVGFMAVILDTEGNRIALHSRE